MEEEQRVTSEKHLKLNEKTIENLEYEKDHYALLDKNWSVSPISAQKVEVKPWKSKNKKRKRGESGREMEKGSMVFGTAVRMDQPSATAISDTTYASATVPTRTKQATPSSHSPLTTKRGTRTVRRLGSYSADKPKATTSTWSSGRCGELSSTSDRAYDRMCIRDKHHPLSLLIISSARAFIIYWKPL